MGFFDVKRNFYFCDLKLQSKSVTCKRVIGSTTLLIWPWRLWCLIPKHLILTKKREGLMFFLEVLLSFDTFCKMLMIGLWIRYCNAFFVFVSGGRTHIIFMNFVLIIYSFKQNLFRHKLVLFFGIIYSYCGGVLGRDLILLNVGLDPRLTLVGDRFVPIHLWGGWSFWCYLLCAFVSWDLKQDNSKLQYFYLFFFVFLKDIQVATIFSSLAFCWIICNKYCN